MAPKAGLLVSHLDWPSVALYAQRANLRHFFNILKRVFMLRVFYLSSTYLTFFIAKLTAGSGWLWQKPPTPASVGESFVFAYYYHLLK